MNSTTKSLAFLHRLNRHHVPFGSSRTAIAVPAAAPTIVNRVRRNGQSLDVVFVDLCGLVRLTGEVAR